jgi:hypothetical protein
MLWRWLEPDLRLRRLETRERDCVVIEDWEDELDESEDDEVLPRAHLEMASSTTAAMAPRRPAKNELDDDDDDDDVEADRRECGLDDLTCGRKRGPPL